MPKDTLSTIFEHNLWANLLLLESCSELTDEQLDTVIPGTYGTIRDTLQHFVRSESSYYHRVSTGQPLFRTDDPPQMTIPEMIESAKHSGNGLIEWAAKVQPDDSVEILWDGTPRDVPKAIILNQVINHATEHRAQVMVTMTQIGIQPPDLQSWEYFNNLDS